MEQTKTRLLGYLQEPAGASAKGTVLYVQGDMAKLAGVMVALSVVVFFVAATIRLRRGRRPGNAAVGAYEELLIKDKQKAMEVIVEGRAEQRDLTKPADGDPDADASELP